MRWPPTNQPTISNRPEMKQIWLETSGHEIHMILGRFFVTSITGRLRSSQAPEGIWAQWFLGKRWSALCAVPLLSPVWRHIVAQDAPFLRSAEIFCGLSTMTRGRPRRLPLARAAANPERTRDRINSRSNSAIDAKMQKTSRPLGVLVSTPSWRLIK